MRPVGKSGAQSLSFVWLDLLTQLHASTSWHVVPLFPFVVFCVSFPPVRFFIPKDEVTTLRFGQERWEVEKSERKRVCGHQCLVVSQFAALFVENSVCLTERWWNVICPILLLPSCFRPCPLFKGIWRMHWGFSCLGFLSFLFVSCYTHERALEILVFLRESWTRNREKGGTSSSYSSASQAPCHRIEKSESFLHLVMHPPERRNFFPLSCRVCIFTHSSSFQSLAKKVCRVQLLCTQFLWHPPFSCPL